MVTATTIIPKNFAIFEDSRLIEVFTGIVFGTVSLIKHTVITPIVASTQKKEIAILSRNARLGMISFNKPYIGGLSSRPTTPDIGGAFLTSKPNTKTARMPGEM